MIHFLIGLIKRGNSYESSLNSLKMARTIGHPSDASQVLLLFAAMKTNTKAKAKKIMKKFYTQLTFDFE